MVIPPNMVIIGIDPSPAQFGVYCVLQTPYPVAQLF